MLEAPYLSSFGIFQSGIRITVKPGDILLFYGTLLHRGVFTTRQPHRRLIQVFDLFQNKQLFQEHHAKIVHIPGDEKHGKMMIELSKNIITEPILNYIGYINTVTGYGRYTAAFQDMCTRCVNRDIRVFSSEGLCSRLEVNGTWQAINKYIILQDTVDMNDADCKKLWRYACYNQQFIIYVIVICFVLIVLMYIIIRAFMRKTFVPAVVKTRSSAAAVRGRAVRRR
jgi:hypothetical protein